MTVEVKIPSRSLNAVTEITVLAPVKRGLIDAPDARSYETRVRLTLRTLNGLRVSSAEVSHSPVIDVIDDIRGVHTFRLGIVDPLVAPKVLLFVAFDGGWEAYMRRIWRELGPFLDLVFCNCEGYLSAHEHSFAAYIDWVRRMQAPTEFFYHAAPVTVSDLQFLRRQERTRLGAPAVLPQGTGFSSEAALPALVALYRLTELYPPLPNLTDGGLLWRAARRLLEQVFYTPPGSPVPPPVPAEPAGLSQRSPAERAAWRWLVDAQLAAIYRKRPAAPGGALPLSTAQVQGGILTPYAKASHGCLMLLALDSVKAAQALCEYLDSRLTTESGAPPVAGAPFYNLSFTWSGLQRCGVPDALLALMPQEFKEGMAARSSTLGDVLDNHPLNWKRPVSGWPQAQPGQPRVDLATVHAVVQCTWAGTLSSQWSDEAFTAGTPLYRAVEDLHAALSSSGVQLLSVQSMQRYAPAGQPGQTQGHFGFVDGVSQPRVDEDIRAGDLLLGFANSLDDPPQNGRLWDHSSFLVVRKLRQDVQSFRDAQASTMPVSGAAGGATLPATLPSSVATPADLGGAAMMGRTTDGLLLDGTAGNGFDHLNDPAGLACPVHSHVRRANPRHAAGRPPPPQTGDRPKPVPRIMRRGMSYGPLPESGAADAADRGLVFMAYNASIAEQFEVIQGWLAGGNSGGTEAWSGQRDPFIGVRRPEDPAHFEFQQPVAAVVGSGSGAGVGTTAWRVSLPTAPLVTLEWGLYLFVPSRAALTELLGLSRAARRAIEEPQSDEGREADKQRTREHQVEMQAGQALINQLRRTEQALSPDASAEQWKLLLEDPSARQSGAAAKVWAAVRGLNGGVMRTSYGVLVARRDLALQVLSDSRLYTATGYGLRMAQSFGEIYLGRDNGPAYRSEAEAINAAIMAVTRERAFDAARVATRAALQGLLPAAPTGTSQAAPAAHADLVELEFRDLVDAMLAELCSTWFGLPDGLHLQAGAWRWSEQGLPTCPGHFSAPSRYFFQPRPATQAQATGQLHGQRLLAAVSRWVEGFAGTPPAGYPLLLPLFKQYPGNSPQQVQSIARTLIGVMMGFLPTVDGVLRSAVYEWTQDGDLWELQQRLLGALAPPPPQTVASLNLAGAQSVLLRPLVRALQLRPVPELVWRTATLDHVLAGVPISADDRVVVSLVSALHEVRDTEPEDSDLSLLFGGDRRTTGHPTHACPGSEAALGVLLGFLTEWLSSTEIRVGLALTALRMRMIQG